MEWEVSIPEVAIEIMEPFGPFRSNSIGHICTDHLVEKR